MRLEVSESQSALFLPDGTRYFFPSENTGSISYPTFLIDASGNKMTYNAGTQTWQDTLGRSVTNPLPQPNSPYETPMITEGLQNIMVPGMDAQPARGYQLNWARLDTVLAPNLGYQTKYTSSRRCNYSNGSTTLISPFLFSGDGGAFNFVQFTGDLEPAGVSRT